MNLSDCTPDDVAAWYDRRVDRYTSQEDTCEEQSELHQAAVHFIASRSLSRAQTKLINEFVEYLSE